MIMLAIQPATAPIMSQPMMLMVSCLSKLSMKTQIHVIRKPCGRVARNASRHSRRIDFASARFRETGIEDTAPRRGAYHSSQVHVASQTNHAEVGGGDGRTRLSHVVVNDSIAI